MIYSFRSISGVASATGGEWGGAFDVDAAALIEPEGKNTGAVGLRLVEFAELAFTAVEVRDDVVEI